MLSLHAAATHACVTEKAIRRWIKWIKSDRLVAEMRGGQYWITPDALERARTASPRESSSSTQEDEDDDQSMSRSDLARVHGHDSPGVGLRPLIDHIARLEGQGQ